MKILITGGSGFIGSNLAAYFCQKHKVTVFDSLEREGSSQNLSWLLGSNKKTAISSFVKGRITDFELVRKLVNESQIVFHLAAQVAVTSSIINPRRDFEVNALGTLNIIESARMAKKKPLIVYSSTNKVYGKVSEKGLKETKTRYLDQIYPEGINEQQPLDFYSPYGCSKGSSDSYVRDYGRIYDLPSVILRKSCIYGRRQFGTEDQGWVAHFVKSALQNKPIMIYGDGKQVRDLLNIEDLLKLYEKIVDQYSKDSKIFRGEVFNVGGGSKNTVSILELIEKLEGILNKKLKVVFKDWRPGDQRVYISNIKKVKRVLNWQPQIEIDEGLQKLIAWLRTI